MRIQLKCNEATEACWQSDRRVEVLIGSPKQRADNLQHRSLWQSKSKGQIGKSTTTPETNQPRGSLPFSEPP